MNFLIFFCSIIEQNHKNTSGKDRARIPLLEGISKLNKFGYAVFYGSGISESFVWAI